jgi:hypothetical protein
MISQCGKQKSCANFFAPRALRWCGVALRLLEAWGVRGEEQYLPPPLRRNLAQTGRNGHQQLDE